MNLQVNRRIHKRLLKKQ